MATRSPSPNPSRPRTPESSHSLHRKSKEIPQRSSLSKPSAHNSPSIRASFEQKENVKSRSPAISSSKGSKNFMAPTISAASKAVPPSPRKKVLQERNEVINSVSSSLEFSVKEVAVCVEIEEFGVKSEMGFGSQGVLGSGKLKKGGSRIKNYRNVIVPSLSPLPVIAPYDPKTNYFSPRPQFLHYRPNPRIEHSLNREGEVLDVGDGRRLEDSFSSESGEDDVTALIEEKDLEEESLLSEVGSPSETIVSEPKFKSKPLKCQPSRRSKLPPFLLVLVMACLHAPLTDSPIISSSMFKEQSLPKFYTPSYRVFEDLQLRFYFAAAANENLHGLASRFKHWSANSIAYFTSETSLNDDVGLYPLVNMTVPSAVDECRVVSELSYELETETEQAVKEVEVAEQSSIGHESEISASVKDEDAECNAETVEVGIMDENTEMEVAKNEAEEIEMVVSEVAEEGDIGAQGIEMGVSEDVVDPDIMVYEVEKDITEEDRRNELEQEASHPSYEAAHIEGEVNNAGIQYIHSPQDVLVKSEITGDEEEDSRDDIISASSVDNQSELAKEYQISHGGLELLRSINYATMLGLSSALVVLAATLAFLSMKQRQIPAVKKEIETIKKIESVSGSSETCIHAKRSSQNSGLSEANSSWNNTSYSGRHQTTKRDKEEQNLSHERKLRRDSLSSYGSFITYEKLPAKKGGRDEEVVTPVRHSSRIRNLVTSP